MARTYYKLLLNDYNSKHLCGKLMAPIPRKYDILYLKIVTVS